MTERSEEDLRSAIPQESVEPVNAAEHRPLYRKRERIYPKIPRGRYRSIKWAAMAILLAVYYLLPWVRWDRGLNAPEQAVLVDIPQRKFYFFFIEIWPQEIYYWTGLLIVAALGLFFISSLFGRVWCGYACPQTVWTDLFLHIERLVEGDRNSRIRLDKARWGVAKIVRKTIKHVIWVLIGVVTGGAWIFYFADAPTLFGQLIRFEAPASAYITMAFLTGTTYLFAGLAREQICTYVCPYARFQSAMVDEDTMLVSYQPQRGEPRGKHKAGASWETQGDCVDCKLCVAVCPQGIDIRDGQQMECITCALCIDACNGVMRKVGRPSGLIRYDTGRKLGARETGEKPVVRLFRPRTLVYSTLLIGLTVVILGSLFTRSDLDITVQRDRNPLFVQLSDGSIRNGYTVKIINKAHEVRDFTLTLDGLVGAEMVLVGDSAVDSASTVLTVGPDALASFRIFVTAPRASLQSASSDLQLLIVNTTGEAHDTYDTVFRGPDAG